MSAPLQEEGREGQEQEKEQDPHDHPPRLRPLLAPPQPDQPDGGPRPAAPLLEVRLTAAVLSLLACCTDSMGFIGPFQ